MKYRCKCCGWECDDIDDMGMHLAFGHHLVEKVYESEEERIKKNSIPEGFEDLYAAIDLEAANREVAP